MAFRRASPGAATQPGSYTVWRKMSAACSSVASWSSSLEPKRPTSPLLLMPSCSASRPIVRPSNPTTDATCTAAASVSAREPATSVADRRGILTMLQNGRFLYIAHDLSGYCHRGRSTSVNVQLLNVGWITSAAGLWRQGEPFDRDIRFPVPAYLIETDEERILIDTGLQPAAIDDPARHY